MAAASLANIVKSSLGPLGLDKMLVDDIGVIDLIRLFSLNSNHYLFDLLFNRMSL